MSTQLEQQLSTPIAACTRARACGWAACGLATAMIAGCGNSAPARPVGTATVERLIAASIEARYHVYTSVHCPPSVPRRVGFAFACAANLEVGSYPVLVTVASTSGRLRYRSLARLVALDTAKVRRAIAASILRQRGLRASVSCPAEVLQQAGISFKCAATVGKRAYPVTVTQVDGNGRVRYIVER
jgi:hypothetical protein